MCHPTHSSRTKFWGFAYCQNGRWQLQGEIWQWLLFDLSTSITLNVRHLEVLLKTWSRIQIWRSRWTQNGWSGYQARVFQENWSVWLVTRKYEKIEKSSRSSSGKKCESCKFLYACFHFIRCKHFQVLRCLGKAIHASSRNQGLHYDFAFVRNSRDLSLP
jgi:hypothetical protein